MQKKSIIMFRRSLLADRIDLPFGDHVMPH